MQLLSLCHAAMNCLNCKKITKMLLKTTNQLPWKIFTIILMGINLTRDLANGLMHSRKIYKVRKRMSMISWKE